jgi:hypothetical protein
MSTYPNKLNELIDLLTALSIKGKDLRRQFHDDPFAVADNLTDQGRAALYSMKRPLMKAECAKEYQGVFSVEKYVKDFVMWEDAFEKWKIPQNEYPDSELDTDCKGNVEYPDPRPEVVKLKPTTIAQGSNLEVIGQGFVKGKTTLEVTDAAGTPQPITAPTMTGTFRCGHLTTTVNAPAGTYKVRVYVDVGGGSRIEVPRLATLPDLTVT